MYHIAALLLTGCDPAALCKGPECADFYSRGRLSVFEPVQSSQIVDVWSGPIVYDGSESLGSGWTSSAIDNGVILGLPDAARVVRVRSRSAEDGLGPLTPIAQWVDEGASSGFGAAVLARLSSDSGEGFDLWVGAPSYEDAEGVRRGAVFVFYDAEDDTAVTLEDADVTLLGASEGDRFGSQLTLCTDLTGDGEPEIVVGAPWFQGSGAAELAGASYVVRSEDVPRPAPEQEPLTLEASEVSTLWWGSGTGEAAGHAVVCGDLDGDLEGTQEVLIGAPWAQENYGRLYLVEETAPTGQLDEVARLSVAGSVPGEWFGSSVALLSDGLVAVGSPGWIRPGGDGTGAVSVLRGEDLMNRSADPDKPVSIDSFTRVSLFVPAPTDEAEHFGRWLYSGELDLDARLDLVVGEPDYHGPDGPDFDTGRLWVWFTPEDLEEWSETGDNPPPDLVVNGQEPFQRIGRAISIMDTDDNGLEELWIPTGWAAPP